MCSWAKYRQQDWWLFYSQKIKDIFTLTLELWFIALLHLSFVPLGFHRYTSWCFICLCLMILQLCIWVFILVLQINKVLVHSFLLLSVPYSVYSPIWKTSLQMCCNSLCVFLLPIFCIFIFYALLMHISLCLTILYFSSVVFNLLLIFI